MGKPVKRDIKIIKASGDVEDLKPEKLVASLMRSGADRSLAEEVRDRVLREIEPLASTKKIYRLAKKYLRKFNRPSGLRYSLKKALLRLGPSGYPFERYYGELLKQNGFRTEVGVFLQGRCAQHEVDVFAVSDKEVYSVECKYHNKPGTATDIKVAMYVAARQQDLGYVLRERYPDRKFRGWLVTNTRLTSDAMKYAHCVGFDVKSWGYPRHDSLEKMIDSRRLYPVTVVTGVSGGLIKKLIEHDIILLKDLVTLDVKEVRKLLSLPEKKAQVLKQQADELCLC